MMRRLLSGLDVPRWSRLIMLLVGAASCSSNGNMAPPSANPTGTGGGNVTGGSGGSGSSGTGSASDIAIRLRPPAPFLAAKGEAPQNNPQPERAHTPPGSLSLHQVSTLPAPHSP